MGHVRKNRLLRLLKELLNNMRVHNLFLIIIPSKDNKSGFKKQKNSIHRGRKLE